MKFDSFNRLPLYTDDFCFYSIEEYKQEKPIVIHNPQDAFIISPVFLRSKKTLGEHILFVQEHQYRSAILIADNIEFVKSCPSLEYLKVFPSTEAVDFDYSPLYSLPNLTKLVCRTTDDDRKKIADIDYSQFQNLKTLYIHGSKGNLNLGKASSVQSLSVEGGYPSADSLVGAIPESLKSLSICQAPLRSLKGIEKAAELSWLSLSYNRILCDISQLSLAADSLKFRLYVNCWGRAKQNNKPKKTR